MACCPAEIMPERLHCDCQSNTNDDAASENEFNTKVIHIAKLLSISTTSEWRTSHIHAEIRTNAHMLHDHSGESGQRQCRPLHGFQYQCDHQYREGTALRTNRRFHLP
nr:MAG TPA: hypothetical protein [Caudoviricetes sp.]